jgi:hypothetical protein
MVSAAAVTRRSTSVDQEMVYDVADSPNFGPARLRARGTFLACRARRLRCARHHANGLPLASVSALRVSTAAAADRHRRNGAPDPSLLANRANTGGTTTSVLPVSVRASLPSDEKVPENRGFPSNLDAPCGQIARSLPLVPSPLVPSRAAVWLIFGAQVRRARMPQPVRMNLEV